MHALTGSAGLAVSPRLWEASSRALCVAEAGPVPPALTHGSLWEARWRPGRDAWRGGREGTQLSKFSYYQYRHVNQTKSPVPEYFCLQNPKYWIDRKKSKPWRALLALSGLSQSMALHSWSKSFKCLLPVEESEHVLSKRWLVPDRPSSPSSPSTKTLAPRFILQPQRPLVKSEAVCVQCFSGCSTFWGARGSKMQEGGVLCGSSRGRRHTHSTLDPPRPV